MHTVVCSEQEQHSKQHSYKSCMYSHPQQQKPSHDGSIGLALQALYCGVGSAQCSCRESS